MTPPLPRHRRLGRHIAAAALAVLAAAAARAAPLDDLRRQVEASQFEQAWATVQANPQLIGDVHFDFLYGLAAINTGRVADGVLALERHLAAVPANDRARLELARGYFLLGEYARARSEFEFVLRYNPPAGVRSTINGFLQAMATRDAADSRSSARFYAELGAGRDNNVNGGTFHDELQLVFGTILPSGGSRQISDDTASVAVGGQAVWRATARHALFAGWDIDHREDRRFKEYNLTNAGVSAGFSQLGAGGLWRLTLGLSELQVGGSRYRDRLHIGADATFNTSVDTSLMPFAQYSELRYAQTAEQLDSRLVSVGFMATTAFPQAPGQPSIGVRVAFTQEHNMKQRSDLGRDQPLVRLFGAVSPLERLRLSAGLTLTTQRFGGEDPAFGTVRRDHDIAVDGSAAFALDTRWSLRAEGAWSRTRSNQSLYENNRKSASLKVRYQY